MRNSILVTSDLKSIVLVDTINGESALAISKRGVLISVLGNEVCAAEVPAELDEYIKRALASVKSFYSFPVANLDQNQLSLTYNEGSNTVFIIGITDIIIEHSSPIEINSKHVKTIAVKLKEKTTEGFSSKSVILARLETTGPTIGGRGAICFYLISL